MPEDTWSDLHKVLDVLEDYAFDTPLTRNQKYKTVQNALENEEIISVKTVERILKICVHDLDDDKKYSSNLLMVITSVLKKVKSGQVTSKPDLLPSALAIINIIKATTLLKNLTVLQFMSFETLLFYPDETLIALVTTHPAEIIEIFNLYCSQKIPNEVRLLPYEILARLLKILPPEKRMTFVKDNIATWFSKVLPTVITAELNGLPNTKLFDAIELLAAELQHIDYSHNKEWDVFLSNIHNPKMYPAVLKNLLENNNQYWHRLWIVFIKLLKNQITQSNSRGSPINALLIVIENAFKMDVSNRCRAFQCWDVLIDNFYNETNEVLIAKRLKLLIIPLHSNNAKVEETAIAKFNTWWLLIRRFQTKIDKYIDKVLIGFFHFCFGKNIPTSNAAFVPGLISNNIKKLCVEAFIEVAGHLDCPGCVTVPKLNGKLMTTNLLVGYWNTFAYSLQKAIIIAADDSVGITRQQVECLWKSFVLTVGELPANNVRRDIFNELLSILEKIIQDNEETKANNTIDGHKLADIVLHLIFSLFSENNNKIESLLKTMCENEGPMFKVLSIILGPISNHLYDRSDIQGCFKKLKPLTDFIMDECMCNPRNIVDWLLKNLSPNNNTLVLWTSLAESVHERGVNTLNIQNILLWPLQNISKFTDVNMASSAWYSLYVLIYTKPDSTDDTQEIEMLIKAVEVTSENKQFILHSSLAILKVKLINQKGNSCEYEIRNIMAVIQTVEDYKILELQFPVLVDTLLLLTNKISELSNKIIIEYTLLIAMKALKLLIAVCKDPLNKTNTLFVLIESLQKTIDLIYNKNEYSDFKQKIIKELIEYLVNTNKEFPLKSSIINLIQTYLSDIKESDFNFYNNINNTLDSIDSNLKFSKESDIQNIDKGFTTPKAKVMTRKAKKKEASIVNTVVENGEEYVVVKSNWKFNPKKLTENQKEKLQRKREDIPALYQDLSQSQDEFKLSTWKTDSQDTSTTNSTKSNSKTNEEALPILKDLTSSDVVPKIIENIFPKNTNYDSAQSTKLQSLEENFNKNKQTVSNVTISPRIALKDRVFRNVRNLIEKSSIQKDVRDVSENIVQIENVPKTPGPKEKTKIHLTNSAPPKLNAERPSRVRRTPRKFDDSEIFSLKKRRTSLSQQDSQLDDDAKETTNCLSEEKVEEKEIQISDTSYKVSKIDKSKEHVTVSKNEILNKHINHTQNESKNDDVVTINSENINEHVEGNTNLLKDIELPFKISKNNSEIHSLENINLINKEEISDKQNKILFPFLNENKMSDIENVSNVNCKLSINDTNTAETPKSTKKRDAQASSKKNSVKKSRIEKELAIDMVEGHPYLKVQTEKRMTRKNIDTGTNKVRRKSLTEKISKTRLDTKTVIKTDKKLKEKEKSKLASTSLIVKEDKKEKNKTKQESSLNVKDDKQGKTRETEDKKEKNKTIQESRINVKEDQQGNTCATIGEFPWLEDKKSIEKNKSNQELISRSVKEDQQDNVWDAIEDLPCSEDVIESSQDSSVTTISVKSSKAVLKKISVVVEKILDPNSYQKPCDTQKIIFKDDTQNEILSTSNPESKDDIELPQNKTGPEMRKDEDLTENMDTEPFDSKVVEEHIVINDDNVQLDIVQNTTYTCLGTETQELAIADTLPTVHITTDICVGTETQELADADTLPTDCSDCSMLKTDDVHKDKKCNENVNDDNVKNNECDNKKPENHMEQEIIIISENDSLTPSVKLNEDANDASSPFKDELQRKKDFLDNTIEISPIKTMSPVRDKKSPSPETSNDYVVIKLSSPVQSNGEPLDKCDSPEIFTDDKISPDKRDQSPPREEVSVNNTSPSSALSLKKNRPQVRSGGRAAQMLGLCVPDRLQSIKHSERSDTEEPKRCSPSNTQARRNLRILYNSVGENNENSEDNDSDRDSENFLKLKRSLPTADCSPAGPILKRKLAEIADEATISPASKRKRVSFHDPPVSTTISVQKYIEPCGIRSPQNSAYKRQERQLRANSNMKSPKRLDTVFKLETVLTKAVESFDNEPIVSTEDTQVISLDETPIVEVVKTSELNDTDPICPELVDCDDPIDLIAGDLSSPATKLEFLKELEGKLAKIGDLAKMTELEVNRLCIKAPKIKIAKKVLDEYMSKRESMVQVNQDVSKDVVVETKETTMRDIARTDMEVQTDSAVIQHVAMQTTIQYFESVDSQTVDVPVTNNYTQTKESGSNSTADVITTCLSERSDFVSSLMEQLEDSSKRQIADSLPFSDVLDSVIKKVTSSNAHIVVNRILEQSSSESDDDNSQHQLSFIQNYLCERFGNKELILFCSQLLQKIYEKPV